ncbi:uncharacterized protein E0L32_006472 [Thyridium curvatum]|uniref:Uncharacterized protein n=1 Tax=Thyridium curvatum TaxID=1093900 RepID=A0A507B1V7_9PEZI|nr:uncharacterized protein E0L32_006472 [Thyridium curvatum]TPX13046.1 hypothetical protein E0L32_006472 [Thyridium curvatum]
MIAATQAAGCLGPRQLLYRPPRGTSWRVLKLRLDRVARTYTRSFSQSQRVLAAHINEPPFLSSDDVRVLQDLILHKPPQPPERLRWQNIPQSEDTGEPESRHWDKPKVKEFLAALEKGDTRALFRHLGLNTLGAYRHAEVVRQDSTIESVVAQLPSTAFSELMRCLDPFVVAKELSASDGISIGPGVAQMTPLGRFVNNYGICTIYVGLLRKLTSIFKVRRETWHKPQFNDYIVLVRCAGAASDMTAAKEIWQMMDEDNYTTSRSSRAYAEFARARFLTEPLYMQYNLPLHRVRPASLFPGKFTHFALHSRLDRGKTLYMLGRLQRNMDLHRKHRFGHNFRKPHVAEETNMILRNSIPVTRVFTRARSLGYDHDVDFLSAMIVATARTGKVASTIDILRKYWNIHISRRKATGSVIVQDGVIPRRSSPMYPTGRLMEAIVLAFGSNSHIAIALKVVNHISQLYRIEIPDKVWFDLLSWTYIAGTKPATTEWKIMGMRHKVLKPDAVQLVWDVMTSAPYNVKPGFDQYRILVNSLIEQRKYGEAIPLMRQLKDQYQAQCRVYEEALWEYSQTRQQRVATGPVLMRYERASAKKWHMWYAIEMWCHKIFKKVRPGDKDTFTTTTIPQLVDEFRNFMVSPTTYRTPTGFVRLHLGPSATRYITVDRLIEVPQLEESEMNQRIRAGRWTPPRYRSDLEREPEDAPIADGPDSPFHRMRPIIQKFVSVKRPVTWVTSPEDLTKRKLNPYTKRWLQREHL